MNYYLKAFRNFSDFSGRARRKEYWMFVLFNILFAFAFLLLGTMMSGGSEENAMGIILYAGYALIAFIPGLAVGVRRLHDVNKSGWWFLIALVPIIGGIWLLVLFATESYAHTNRWGENPKYMTP